MKPGDELGLVEAGMRQRTFQRLCKMIHDTPIKVHREHFFFLKSKITPTVVP